MADAHEPISAAACYDYILEKVFPLRPADYCEKYPQWPGMVGLELEMLPLWQSSVGLSKPETVPLFGPKSLTTMLQTLKSRYPAWTFQVVPEEPDHLLNVQLDDADQLTFEPGGQLEFSTRPYPCLGDALRRLREVQSIVRGAAAESGIRVIQIGMNPWLTVDEIGLQMTKPRYRAMDSFFTAQGPEGRRMMRQTCTIQVNLDFGGTEEVLAKRYLISNLVAPFATAMFANSPFLDGQANGILSNRANNWQHMDPTRTGWPYLDTIVKRMDRKSCVDAYLDYALKGKVVFAQNLNYQVMDGRLSFADWIDQGVEGLRPTLDDFKTHLSLLFPEARARGFIELRSIDCQHEHWQSVPASFYTGLLYDEKSLDAALDLLLPLRPKLRAFWQKSIYGLRDDELAAVAQKVARVALQGTERLPSCFQGEGSGKLFTHFEQTLTQRRLTPADLMLEAARKDGHGRLTVAGLDRLAQSWAESIG
ncbi:MAG: glutamate-cysteine ligase family protein [Oligoflexus sp.]